MSGGGRARVHAGELPAASAALPSINSNTPRLVEASRLLRRRSSKPRPPSAAAPAAPLLAAPEVPPGPASGAPAVPSSTLPANSEEAVSLAVCQGDWLQRGIGCSGGCVDGVCNQQTRHACMARQHASAASNYSLDAC